MWPSHISNNRTGIRFRLKISLPEKNAFQSRFGLLRMVPLLKSMIIPTVSKHATGSGVVQVKGMLAFLKCYGAIVQ